MLDWHLCKIGSPFEIKLSYYYFIIIIIIIVIIIIIIFEWQCRN